MRARAYLLWILCCLTLLWIHPAAAEKRARLSGPVRGGGKLVPWGRAIDKAHPLRRDVGKEALLRTTLRLMEEGSEARRFPRHVRKALAKYGAVAERQLQQPKTLRRLMERLTQEVGEQAAVEHVGERARVSRKVARHALPAGRRGRFSAEKKDDLQDMQRGWGWALLPQHDKAFDDARLLAGLLAESGQTGAGHFIENAPSGAYRRFENAWSKVAPSNTKLHAFALTGTDANNLLYDIAREAARSRSKKGEIDDAEILYFEGVYGGGRGRIAGTSFLGVRATGPRLDDYKIVSPHTYEFAPKDKGEQARLRKLEKQALAQIKEKVKGGARPVGGIIIEPILGAKGVYAYRPKFMRELRALCDELKIPIFADEILTGGGRTGKFFAYEHYKGFEPDFVTFGKGLQLAGVAKVERGSRSSFWVNEGMTTLKVYNEPLLKGAAILERIHEGKLIDNAAKMGTYLLSKLREGQGEGGDPMYRPRGFGLLLHPQGRLGNNVRGAMGRLMPYLTLSRDEVDGLLGAKISRSAQRRAAGAWLSEAQKGVDAVIRGWPQKGGDAQNGGRLDLALTQAREQVERAMESMPSTRGTMHQRAQGLLATIVTRQVELHIALAEQLLEGRSKRIEASAAAMARANAAVSGEAKKGQKTRAQQLFRQASEETFSRLEVAARKALRDKDIGQATLMVNCLVALSGERTIYRSAVAQTIGASMDRQRASATPTFKKSLRELRAKAQSKAAPLKKKLEALEAASKR